MRIKTRYLLLVPLILIMLISSGVFIHSAITIDNYFNTSPSVIEFIGFLSTMLISIGSFMFIAGWLFKNWDNDFYINLKFKNKSRES